jgi:hypothetical protein
MLQQSYQQGNVIMGGGAPGEYRPVITNYVKQGDNMTLVMNKAQKSLVSLSISTYLSDPNDAVEGERAICEDTQRTEPCGH